MKHLFNAKPVLLRVVFAGLFLLSLLALTPQAALAQDFPPVVGECMADYVSPVNCTAQDMRIKEIVDVTYSDYCDGTVGDTMTAHFTILVSAESTPPRYDIGIFIAKNGNSPEDSGVCYQDYLAPTLTTTPIYGDWNDDTFIDIYESYPYGTVFNGWWDGDGDTCGDMDDGTQVFLTNVEVTVACHDSTTDADTNADVIMCVAWDEQASNDCSSVLQTYPDNPAKCSCETINFPFTPTVLEQMSLEARSSAASTNLLWGSLGLLLVAGAFGSYWLYRKQTSKIV